MLRAVPDTVRTADSRLVVFRSTSFSLAISSTCFRVTLPTLVRFGSAEPLTIPAARLSSSDAGGVLVTNVKLRSLYTVTSTGMIMPSGSLLVLALNCLQKSMMLTPCGPSAVPTGGAGVALAAGNCNLTTACTFFAILLVPYSARRSSLGDLFDLREIQLDRSRASKNSDRNFQRAAVGVDLFNFAGEVGEGAVHNAHLLVTLEDQLGLGLVRGSG